jgi:Cu-Zn family superoxide dismutase
MQNIKKMVLFTALMAGIQVAYASVEVPMALVDAKGDGKSIGTIKLENAFNGVLITPNLHDLPAGVHGFHVHVNPSCADNGMAAGGHLDPKKTDAHNGPYNHKGHLGDMPVLVVNEKGDATLPTLAPRFTLKDVEGHSIMIHAGGDNYSDQPEKLGGGGARIACGIIPKK